MSVHATGEYIVSTSTDKSWAFSDIATGKCLQLVQGDISGGFSASMVHPDGLILGSGTTDGMVRIWDLKSQQVCRSYRQRNMYIIYIYLSIYLYIYIYICTHTHIYIYICVCKYMYTYDMSTYMHMICHVLIICQLFLYI